MTTTHGGAIRSDDIHFPGECPAGPKADRIIQLLAVAFLSCIATLGLMAVISGGMPWSPMGQAHQPPPAPVVQQQTSNDSVCV
ncbi:MAG TPA: hypothetical protein VFH56_14005 [Acidimicrobiales bacterium]|nr:hypothetical protein [Acidimicrobiales bacterium]